MTTNKKQILDNICYTDLVYGRINKKLGTNYSRCQIEDLVRIILEEVYEEDILKIGKNYYISDLKKNIKLTINSNTFRIITADRV